jgi:hypothetical protein
MIMADTINKGALKIVDGADIITVYPETEADIVLTDDGSNVAAELTALKAAVGGAAKFYTADNIAGMYALEVTPQVNVGDRCYVIDATDDETVSAGGAEYLWIGDWWIKISEAESMDLVATWADLQNKPSSSVADIDAAVTAKHAHSNKAVLDKLTEGANGLPLYDGAQIGGVRVVESIPGGAADGLYFVTVNGGGE